MVISRHDSKRVKLARSPYQAQHPFHHLLLVSSGHMPPQTQEVGTVPLNGTLQNYMGTSRGKDTKTIFTNNLPQ